MSILMTIVLSAILSIGGGCAIGILAATLYRVMMRCIEKTIDAESTEERA